MDDGPYADPFANSFDSDRLAPTSGESEHEDGTKVGRRWAHGRVRGRVSGKYGVWRERNAFEEKLAELGHAARA